MALRVVNLMARLVVGGAFIYAGILKVQGQLQFAATIDSHRLVPAILIPWIVPVLPWIEIAVGVLLLAGWKTRRVAAAAALLLLGFMATMAITYARGIEADCGCFGPGERISPLTIVRELLFLIPSVYLVLRPKPDPATL